MEFRKDIGGLRAYAVVAVVLYHFGVPGFQGGFVGVDVFFVISGFLMTRMILPRLAGAGFSLKGFYYARARRIIPALAVLCALIMGVGWWQLGPSEYGLVGKHAAASIAFVSNMVYWGESGYFDASSHEKWLLHTWSLSVEWQFYLLFPLFLIGLSRMFRARDRYLWATCLAFAASLVVSVVCTRLWPNASFYLLPTRAWEMLAGTLVYLVQDGRPQPGPRLAQVLEASGVVLILWAVVGFDASVPWPGSWAVIPALGAALVLMAMRSESIWTGTAPAQALGAWSYSIYLWHWPLQVASSRLEERGWILVTGGVLVSVVLGYASYVFVESPMRRTRKSPWGLLYFGVLVAVIAVIGIIIARTDGFLQARFGDSPRHTELLQMLSFRHYDRASYREGECFLRPNQDDRSFGAKCIARSTSSGVEGVRVVLWGDSHAAHLWPGLARWSGKFSLSQLNMSSCPPFMGFQSTATPNCARVNEHIARKVEEMDADVVILAASWTHQQTDLIQRGLEATVKRIQYARSRRIVLIGNVPTWRRSLPGLLGDRIADGTFRTRDPRGIDEKSMERSRLVEELARELGVEFFSPSSVVCNDEGCLTSITTPSGTSVPFAWDYGHLTAEASNILADRLVGAGLLDVGR